MDSEGLRFSQTCLGHEDVLSAEAIIRACIVMIHFWDGNVGIRAKIRQSGYFRLCLDPWHETTSDSRYDLMTIDESDEIGLVKSPFVKMSCQRSIKSDS